MSEEEITALMGNFARSRIVSDAKVLRVWEEPRYGLWLAWLQSRDIGTFQLQARQAGGKWSVTRYDGILRAN